MHFEAGVRAGRAGRFADARAAFQRAAESGDPRGWFALGQLASEGKGEPEDPAKAASLYRRAADAGCAGAAHSLAALHALGRGVERDAAKALEWYRHGADLGDNESSFKAALMLARGEVEPPSTDAYAEAERRWRALAAEGHLASILWLGHFFNYLGPESAPITASSFYLDVMGRADADPLARAEAERFVEPLSSILMMASYSGDPEAAHQAGRWYDHAQQRDLALRYFEQAAAAGHAAAQRAVAERVSDEERVVALYTSAAEAGDAVAQTRLGVRFATGDGVPKDLDRALVWFQQAADQGHVEAMALLAEQLERMARHEEARRWYARAAERKHPGAMMAAANAYRDGRGGPRDGVQALRWYLGLLNIGNGDGIHEAQRIASGMVDDEIREAARLAGDPSLAEPFLAARTGR